MTAPRRDRAEVLLVQQTSAFEPTQRVQASQLSRLLLLELPHATSRRHDRVARRAAHRLESREVGGVLEELKHVRADDMLGKSRNGLGLHGAGRGATVECRDLPRIGRYEKTTGRRLVSPSLFFLTSVLEFFRRTRAIKKFAKKFALGRFEPAEGNLPSRDSFPQTSARARRVSPPARTLGSAFAPRLAPHERAR